MQSSAIYWFLPRGFFGYVSLIILLLVLWLGYKAWKAGKPLFVVYLLTVALATGWYATNRYVRYQNVKAAIALGKADVAHLNKVCKNAHYTVYEKVSPQRSIYLMTPIYDEPTPDNYRDQYWRGDSQGSTGNDRDLAELLGTADLVLSNNPAVDEDNKERFNNGFDYVEAPDPENQGGYLRFALKLINPVEVSDADDKPVLSNVIVGKTQVAKITSKYGYRFEDISTNEDRDHWIIGRKDQIVELATGKVVMEYLSYGIAPYRGSWSNSFNPVPWRYTKFHADGICRWPPMDTPYYYKRGFMKKLRQPTK